MNQFVIGSAPCSTSKSTEGKSAEVPGRSGCGSKVIRSNLRIRKKDHEERQEEEAILELYMQALGMT